MNETAAPKPPVGLALRHAHLRAARIFAEELRPLDLENVLAGILIHIGFLGPQTQRQLIDTMGSDKSSMVRHIDALEARGLVRREPHPTDRRAHAVVITEAGRDMLGTIMAAADRTEQRLMLCFSAEERERFRELLIRFAQA